MFNQIVMNITFLIKLIIAKYESDFKSKNLKNSQEICIKHLRSDQKIK